MKRFLFLVVLILALGVSGCNLSLSKPAEAQGSGARAWFDAPLPQTIIRPPNPCQIVAHGASPGGITSFELSINGAVAATIASPDTQSSLVTLSRDCGLSQPGEYQLRIRVLNQAGQWSDYAETSVVILGNETPTGTPNTAEPAMTSTPTPTFTPSPTSAPAGAVSIERISTDMVYLGGSSCGPLEVTITARATAPKGIQVVVLFYRFATGGNSSGFENVAMNPMGGDLYQFNLNPTTLLGGSVPFDQATLQYQIVVQQVDGDTSVRTPVLADIALQACGSTPAAACSSYTDKRSCRSHGCNWVAIPGTVPIYACKEP